MNNFIVLLDSVNQTAVFIDLNLLYLRMVFFYLSRLALLSSGIYVGELLLPIDSSCGVEGSMDCCIRQLSFKKRWKLKISTFTDFSEVIADFIAIGDSHKLGAKVLEVQV